jgi:hypothetical protein
LIRRKTRYGLGAAKGVYPSSIWKNTTPRAHRSHSTPQRLLRTVLGDRYSGVPIQGEEDKRSRSRSRSRRRRRRRRRRRGAGADIVYRISQSDRQTKADADIGNIKNTSPLKFHTQQPHFALPYSLTYKLGTVNVGLQKVLRGTEVHKLKVPFNDSDKEYRIK